MTRVGLVFDFDGTIALSEPVHMQSWVDLAEECDKALPAGFLAKTIGQTDERLARELASAWAGQPDMLTILAKKAEHYQRRCQQQSTLVPGIEALLAHYHGKLPMGIATSASLQDITPTLEMHGLRHYFDAILTVESVTRPKPHPEIYLLAAKKLGIDPKRSFVFEDSPTGATAARAAGMRVIGMLTTYELHQIEPVEVGLDDYRNLEQIKALIG